MNKHFLGKIGLKIVFRSFAFNRNMDAVKIETYVNGVLICAEDNVSKVEAERGMQMLRDAGMLGYDRHETSSDGHIVRVWTVPENVKPEAPPAGGYTPGPRQAKAEMPETVISTDVDAKVKDILKAALREAMREAMRLIVDDKIAKMEGKL